ncbi:NAD(P)-dependent oxidoreductase [Leucobacter sp. wl10]|uniref:NAD(P)-dependent oxidoreductase n=1 Tax=Leucobacter sp. wl10 TaxID=2304677 RepID=UPI000E5BC31C|nr:NAD(P)-dependent oxidoreductase [Leucobacter sp. wl10]RGE24287.1 NAD(P)-dependent oxidoreductase [Leucobacter sp. wl10]
MQKRIAVIGLGAMGGAMAATLVRAGWEVTGFDPSEGARSAAQQQGVRPVDALDAIGGVEHAVLSLPNAALVRSTVPALLEIPALSGIVDTTTSEPGTSREMSALAEQRGVAFIDSPVSGGRTGAATGRLSAFIGGTESAVEACAPVLDSLTGGQYRHLGGPGAGNVVKLINNALCAANLVTVGEALAIAKAWGVDPQAAVEGVSSATGSSRVSNTMYPDWVLSGTHDSGFTMGLMARDVHLALEIAGEAGERPALLGTVDALWQQSLADLGGAADFTEIARAVAPAITEEAAARLNEARNPGGTR